MSKSEAWELCREIMQKAKYQASKTSHPENMIYYSWDTIRMDELWTVMREVLDKESKE